MAKKLADSCGARRKPSSTSARILGNVGLWGSLLSISCPLIGVAQESPTPAADPALIQKLLKRVDELEHEVSQLRQGQQSSTRSAAAAMDAALPKEEAFPQVQFHGFGDITYHLDNGRDSRNTFTLGQLDLFITSRISENINILTESVVEADPSDNRFGFEIERLLFQYHGSDWFNLDVGRYHTSIGYYNTAYHHGTWFQTAVGRPQFLDFEDGGGLIATHNVGISMHGELPSGSMNLNYALEVGNGRPYQAPNGNSPVLNVQDDNEYKAVNLSVFVKPDAIPGLQTGVGIYHDTLTPTGLSRTDEWLLHGHVVYKNSTWEWLNEGFLMRHAPRHQSAHYTPAAYTQISRGFGKFRPYFRFSYIHAPDSDAALTLIGANGLRWGPSIGIRYDFSPMAALKIQYDRVQQSSDRNLNQFVSQVSFTF